MKTAFCLTTRNKLMICSNEKKISSNKYPCEIFGLTTLPGNLVRKVGQELKPSTFVQIRKQRNNDIGEKQRLLNLKPL
jgi:hypothetical protein